MNPNAIPYYSFDKRLLGFITEAQAVLLQDVKLVRRKRTGELKRVIDRIERLHAGEFLGRDVVSRPIWTMNDGRCFEEELFCHRVYALKGKRI